MRFRPTRHLLRALAVALLGLVAAGCGADSEAGMIPEQNAAKLQKLLDEAEERFREGHCENLAVTLNKLDHEAELIASAGVDGELPGLLNAELRELGEMSTSCRSKEEPVVEPVPAPVETVPPAPPPVEPPPEEAKPKEKEAPEEKKPPKEEPPAEKPPKEEPPPEKPPKEPPPEPPPQEQPPPKDP